MAVLSMNGYTMAYEIILEIWEGAGHFPFLKDPSRFNRRLELFVRRCLIQAHVE